jgi:hypothetical protein
MKYKITKELEKRIKQHYDIKKFVNKQITIEEFCNIIETMAINKNLEFIEEYYKVVFDLIYFIKNNNQITHEQFISLRRRIALL